MLPDLGSTQVEHKLLSLQASLLVLDCYSAYVGGLIFDDSPPSDVELFQRVRFNLSELRRDHSVALELPKDSGIVGTELIRKFSATAEEMGGSDSFYVRFSNVLGMFGS